MSLRDDLEFHDLVSILEDGVPETIDDLNDRMAAISNVLLSKMVQAGMDVRIATKVLQTTIYQTGLYYDWRKAIEDGDV